MILRLCVSSPVRSRVSFAAAVCVLAGGLAGCAHNAFVSPPKAEATLAPTRGQTATGTLSLEQQGEHVMVVANVSGLKPGQEHGFHIHEKGDCSSGDGLSTGGHFNPSATPHGPQDGPHHAGDMPALKADAHGQARVSFLLEGVTLAAGPNSLVGRGVIVHAGPDDYRTQPTGNSGARIACGVIRSR